MGTVDRIDLVRNLMLQQIVIRIQGKGDWLCRVHIHIRLVELGMVRDPEDTIRTQYNRILAKPLRNSSKGLGYLPFMWAAMDDEDLYLLWNINELTDMWDYVGNPLVSRDYTLPHTHDWLLEHTKDRLELDPNTPKQQVLADLNEDNITVTSMNASYVTHLRL